MPIDKEIRKVLVIGSGPIVIGQAAEFDYAGTQGCRALMEEGVEVVLINSNPATVMTDKETVSRVYIEPIDAKVIENIIKMERPDSLIAGLGGQTALNMAMELHDSGVLDSYNVRLLGTSPASIKLAEDRDEFKKLMERIEQPLVESVIVNDVEGALRFAHDIGYPLIIRPAYTLGGTGGGTAHNDDEMREIAESGLAASRVHQVLIDRSVYGWKEIEFEVVRDHTGHSVIVCHMENVDPVGIHTGDSIVVAPCVTLPQEEIDMLTEASRDIVDALDIVGGCNVQFALRPDGKEYFVIEVNPRVSRSSALASKATGYPIARVSAKLALGYALNEIHSVDGKTYAHLEPQIDYTVLKFPRWPFDKFVAADRQLGTKMKATGEVMSIAKTFKGALNKAIRSLELGLDSLYMPKVFAYSRAELHEKLGLLDDERLFVIARALYEGYTVAEICAITRITPWFVEQLQEMVLDMKALRNGIPLTPEYLEKLKGDGLSDRAIAEFCGKPEPEIKALRREHGIAAHFLKIDVPAGATSYYYSDYSATSEKQAPAQSGQTVVVLGSGPIRIGQGVEFDYCCVHCAWGFKRLGYETVIINNNPETVSTDFDTADRLYFEPLTPEDVENVLLHENPAGVVAQFGGQTAIKLTKTVGDLGYALYGTQQEFVDMAEDRERFDALLERLDMARPRGFTVFTIDEAAKAAETLGYPVLVRPSYVLGGQGMEIAYNDENIRRYMEIVNRVKQEHPVLIDKYMSGKEVEVDAVCDGQDVLIPGIMEHVERAGVHSGDSISVYPPQSLSKELTEKIVEKTREIALAMQIRGLVNIQYIAVEDELFIIEVNPRSSRTVPFISKITDIPLVALATRCMVGEKLGDMGYGVGLLPNVAVCAVKVPVFSLEKLPDIDVTLGPEMKSTGEVLGVSKNFNTALLKGLVASGMRIRNQGSVVLTVNNADKREAVQIARDFEALGFTLYATGGTHQVLSENGIRSTAVMKIGEGSSNILDIIRSDDVALIISTPTKGRQSDRDGFKIRRLAVERQVPCFTSLDTARALLNVLKMGVSLEELVPVSIHDLKRKKVL